MGYWLVAPIKDYLHGLQFILSFWFKIDMNYKRNIVTGLGNESISQRNEEQEAHKKMNITLDDSSI